MAALPKPIGIDATLVAIATGIGHAAKLLPDLSRSVVGAVAVKTARVRIEFDMARTAEKSTSGVELGVRTFAVTAGRIGETTTSRASNHGVIDLEIVAVAETTAPPDRAPPLPPGGKQREVIAHAIDLLKMPATTERLSDADRKVVDELVAQAEAALADGNLAVAAAAIAEIERLFTSRESPQPAPATPARRQRKRSR